MLSVLVQLQYSVAGRDLNMKTLEYSGLGFRV